MNIKRAFCLAMSLALLTGPATAGAQGEAVHADPRARAKVDARGFIDVWQLRDEVAALELLEASDDDYYCSPEGDGTESPAQLKRALQQQKACEAAVRTAFLPYDRARKSFNLVWGPLIRTAIRRGDRVAEVIMRQCDTTPVLDRSGVESTCDQENRRRSVAIKRLAAIGFVPATIDEKTEFFNLGGLADDEYMPQLAENQTRIMNKMRSGALAFEKRMIQYDRNGADDAVALEAIRRWAVMEAVVQDAPRAFTISSLARYDTASKFPTLRLNRQAEATHPGSATWGRARYQDQRDNEDFRISYWRSAPRWIYTRGRQTKEARLLVAGKGALEFEQARAKLLAEIAANIDRTLAADPRWGVFLLERVGHHEWAPTGRQSMTSKLAAAWEGTWVLDKEAQNWSSSPMSVRTGRAVIKRDGEYTRMSTTIAGAQEPLLNVVDCTLRYSGGDIGGTRPLMESRQVASTEAGAPLKVNTRYKQVLMQCDNAEAADVDRVRFLLLAGDVLIEIGASDVFGQVSLRHYHRLN